MIVVVAMMLRYNPRAGMVYFVVTPSCSRTSIRGERVGRTSQIRQIPQPWVYNNEADNILSEIQGASLNSIVLRLRPLGITFWILLSHRDVGAKIGLYALRAVHETTNDIETIGG
jgi:hypothetical protein